MGVTNRVNSLATCYLRLATKKVCVLFRGGRAEANSAYDVVQRYNTTEDDGCKIEYSYSCSRVRCCVLYCSQIRADC